MPVRHDPSRRRFLATSSAALVATGFADGGQPPPGNIRTVIHLFMEGGMSHLETFDPKRGHPSIATNVPGISISANLPRIAERMDKITLIRSMSHTAMSHSAAAAEAMTFPAEWKFENPGEISFLRNVRKAAGIAATGNRFLRVVLNGWDTHTESSRRNKALSAILDEAFSSLLDDLTSRDLLKETIVVVNTEFGRNARTNHFGGSNHHPHAYTCLLAGGGFGGQSIGSTSSDGMEVTGEVTSPADLIAKIIAQFG